MATVRFEKATRVYPGTTRPAVDALDLDITDGEFLVLVGPSGSGKSTALRMLAGLEDVDQGAIFIADRDVTNLPPKERDIAMVFQNYALYPHMTVYENMAFALKLRHTPKHEIEQRVKEAAALLQLDEPLSNLDAKLRVQTRTQIATLQANLGITTVYVTHDQVEAMTMGHRVAVLDGGILQQVDTPRALYDRPVNVFVAGFIGSPAMNIKTVPLDDEGGVFGGMVLPLTREQVAAARDDGTAHVRIGFRPEHTELVGADDGGMPIEVELVEELGSDAFVYGTVALEGHDERFVVRVEPRKAPQMGEIVHVKPRVGAHHAFHAVTGERL